jgi:hypothetical protein
MRALVCVCGILLVIGLLIGGRSYVEAQHRHMQDPNYLARRACINDVRAHSDDYQDEGALSAAVAGCRHGG